RGRLVQPTRMFNREASLGLVTRAGTVTLGRLPDLVYEYITKFLSPPAATAIVSKHPGNWDNYASQYQYSSTVMYSTPVMGGFSAAAMYSFGEDATQRPKPLNMSLGARNVKNGWRTAAVFSEHR